MSDSQHDDGYVWTWEPAAGALTTVAILVILAAQAGRSIALALAGAGWHWPPSTTLATSTAGILTGNLNAGLDISATRGAGEPVVAWTVAAVLFVAALTVAVVVAMRWLASRRYKGMATTAHAEQLLGLGRLRATRAVIRPDLYNKANRP